MKLLRLVYNVTNINTPSNNASDLNREADRRVANPCPNYLNFLGLFPYMIYSSQHVTGDYINLDLLPLRDTKENGEGHENSDNHDTIIGPNPVLTSRNRIYKKTDTEDTILKAGLAYPVEYVGECGDGYKIFRVAKHEDKVYVRLNGLLVDDYSDAF